MCWSNRGPGRGTRSQVLMPPPNCPPGIENVRRNASQSPYLSYKFVCNEQNNEKPSHTLHVFIYSGTHTGLLSVKSS